MFWVLVAVILLLDQSSKIWILHHYWAGRSVAVIPAFFNLTFVANDGMAFGLFQGNNLRMGLVVCLILVIGFRYARSFDWNLRETNLIGALFVSGAIGNLSDRFRLGYVVDFADFYFAPCNWHWPAFNVADSCITLAVIWVFLRLSGCVRLSPK